MHNLHNRYKSAERNISEKNPEYMLNYPFPCSCSKNLSSFRLIIKQQWLIEELSIFGNSSHLEWRTDLSDTILIVTHPRTAGMVPRWALSKLCPTARTPFKMAVVTENINFFNCPLLL
jgi:hypothetical protein